MSELSEDEMLLHHENYTRKMFFKILNVDQRLISAIKVRFYHRGVIS